MAQTESASLVGRYNAAMMAGNCELALRIEERCGLAGYPPEIVSVGLRAMDKGEDAGAAIDAYIGHADGTGDDEINPELLELFGKPTDGGNDGEQD